MQLFYQREDELSCIMLLYMELHSVGCSIGGQDKQLLAVTSFYYCDKNNNNT